MTKGPRPANGSSMGSPASHSSETSLCASSCTPLPSRSRCTSWPSLTAVELPTREGFTLALVVLQGRLLVNGTAVSDGQLGHLDREGSGVQLDAQSDVSLLWLAGEPIDEPLAGRGPFVMNSEEEILQAIQDFRAGHFGHLAN